MQALHLLAMALILAIASPAIAQPQRGSYEGGPAELDEDTQAGTWSIRRDGQPTLILRPATREAALLIGAGGVAISYEPLALFPPDGATPSAGPRDPERACTTTLFSTPADAVAHCRTEDGRLLWAAVRDHSAWRFVWIAAP